MLRAVEQAAGGFFCPPSKSRGCPAKHRMHSGANRSALHPRAFCKVIGVQPVIGLQVSCAHSIFVVISSPPLLSKVAKPPGPMPDDPHTANPAAHCIKLPLRKRLARHA